MIIMTNKLSSQINTKMMMMALDEKNDNDTDNDGDCHDHDYNCHQSFLSLIGWIINL